MIPKDSPKYLGEIGVGEERDRAEMDPRQRKEHEENVAQYGNSISYLGG